MLLRLIPNILTACNLSAGLCAIYISAAGRADIACRFVIASVIFDGLDGWTARRLKQETHFGRIFDSMADFVSFGLAPAFIYYNFVREKNIVILSTIFFYISASAIRLIRFNRPGKDTLLKNFEGLPTTASASVLVLLIALFYKEITRPVFFTAAFITLSLLMLSRIRVLRFNR